jgi:ribose transport system ATP-binding protein
VPPHRPPLLELRGLSKSFSGVRVLSAVDLDIRAGEIHALIGQNGSGKSTLIKLLSGYHAPDSGSVTMRGRRLALPIRPGEAPRLGLHFLHQDVGVVGSMTVLENLRAGRYRTTPFGRVRWPEERRAARETLAAMRLAIDPDLRVRDVPAAERALLGFARALQDLDHARGDVLVLDEPTAFLPGPSVGTLFAAMREVARLGSAVIFVSHRLDEIMTIADRVSVLRDGRLVQTIATAATTARQLVAAMLGREPGGLYPARTTTHGRPVLSVTVLGGRMVRDIAFDVHGGEIVGLTGLLGMGHDEVPYLLFGATPAQGGCVRIGDRRLAALTPQQAIAAGMALLPADRQRQNGIPNATLLENVAMTSRARLFGQLWLRHAAERRSVQRLLNQLDVRPAEPDRKLRTLSGGNQQKALLGKWLRTAPAAILLHEPTQGVDIGARRQLLQKIADIAGAGAAVLIASAEYDELAHLCHRVLIFRHGRVAGELTGEALSEARIAEQCYLA